MTTTLCGAAGDDGRRCRHKRGTAGRCAAGHPAPVAIATTPAGGLTVASADPFAPATAHAAADPDAAQWQAMGHDGNPAYDSDAEDDITDVFDVIIDLGFRADETWTDVEPDPAWMSNQETIDPDRVAAMVRNPPTGDGATIELVTRHGDVYIFDGCHRTAAAIIAGRPVTAVVMNADELEVYSDLDGDTEADDDDWYGLG